MRKYIFVIVVALCLVGIGQAFADDVCEEFKTFETPFGVFCLDTYYIPWIAFGGGWKTTIMWANISDEATKGMINFVVDLAPASGPRAVDGHWQYLSALVTDNKIVPIGALRLVQSTAISIWPVGSVELALLHTPAGCNKYSENCEKTPDPEDKTSVGSASVTLAVRIEDGGAAALRGLPKPSAQFNYIGGWQAIEPAFTPAPVWRTRVASTPDRKQEFMFAMGNPYLEDTVVEGKIFNQDGKVLGTQTWTLPGQNTKGLYITGSKTDSFPGFGDDPFPGGKDFTGWLELRVISPSTGAISIVGLQSEGGTEGTMSNSDVQPFYPKQ
jgi:hypothetical protein